MTTIAFAGAGPISAVHGLAAAAIGITVTAVASRTPATATARAQQLGATPVPYEDLPAGADLVVVCTPPHRHADDAMQALQGGAAALVETPLTTTLADADRLVAATGASGGRLAYAENVAHAPAMAGALTRRHLLGDLTHLDGRAVQPPPVWDDDQTEARGGGVLLQTGCHLVAAALLLARPARPATVSARLEPDGRHGVDEHAEVTLAFDNGLRAQLTASWRGGQTAHWDVQAAGRSGVVHVELLPSPALEVNGDPVPLPPPREDLADGRLEELGYCAQMTVFAAHVSSGRPPPIDAALGRDVLDVICAAYDSAADGGRGRPLPFTGPRDRTPLQLWRD